MCEKDLGLPPGQADRPSLTQASGPNEPRYRLASDHAIVLSQAQATWLARGVRLATHGRRLAAVLHRLASRAGRGMRQRLAARRLHPLC